MEKGDDTQSDTASSHKDSRKDTVVEGQDAQLGQGRGEAVDEAKCVETLFIWLIRGQSKGLLVTNVF